MMVYDTFNITSFIGGVSVPEVPGENNRFVVSH